MSRPFTLSVEHIAWLLQRNHRKLDQHPDCTIDIRLHDEHNDQIIKIYLNHLQLPEPLFSGLRAAHNQYLLSLLEITIAHIQQRDGLTWDEAVEYLQDKQAEHYSKVGIKG